MTALNIDIIISAICFIGFICSLLFLLSDAKEQEIISNEHNSKHYTKHDHDYMRKYNE